MHIFIQDHVNLGCIVVISDTEENARKLMKEHGAETYEESRKVSRHDIKIGFNFVNYGDL